MRGTQRTRNPVNGYTPIKNNRQRDKIPNSMFLTSIPDNHLMIHRSEPYGTAALLFFLSFLFFSLFRIATPLNVDTYLYARAIETFEGTGIHFGYYLLGAVVHDVLEPVGLTPLQTLGGMSQFFGGISVAGMYVFTFLLTNNRPHAFLRELAITKFPF